jgi:DNA-binding NarL/FixJ family response regulator
MIGVLVADDQELVRAGLRSILAADPDLHVVGEAEDGEAAVRAAARLRPDIVLMDVRMPVMDGLEATRRITAGGEPRPRVIVLTTFDLDEYVYAALRAGASGFLLKGVPAPELCDAVRTVAAGDALIAPSVTRRLIEAFARSGPPPAPPDALDELTEREHDVLTLLARGMSNAEIAAELYLSAATVKTHVAHVLMKLGVRDRVRAVIHLYESGVLRPGGS